LLIDVWAVLRHFYPYQEEVSVPWEDVLRQALRDTEDDESEADLIDSIRTLTRALKDGHARVERDGRRGIGWLPVRTTCVDDAVVVAASEDPNLAVGDVIETIDGAPAWPRAQAIAEGLSGTSQWRAFRACTWDGARGPGDGTVTWGIKRAGALTQVQTRYERHEIVPDNRPEAFGEPRARRAVRRPHPAFVDRPQAQAAEVGRRARHRVRSSRLPHPQRRPA